MRWAWASGFGGACAGDRLGFRFSRSGGRALAGRGLRGFFRWNCRDSGFFQVESWGLRGPGFRFSIFSPFLTILGILDVGPCPCGEKEFRFMVGFAGLKGFRWIESVYGTLEIML